MLLGKQILFPQQCFQGWANRESFEETLRITIVSTTMFPSLPRALRNVDTCRRMGCSSKDLPPPPFPRGLTSNFFCGGGQCFLESPIMKLHISFLFICHQVQLHRIKKTNIILGMQVDHHLLHESETFLYYNSFTTFP